MKNVIKVLRNDRGAVLILGVLTLAMLAMIGAFSVNNSTLEAEITGIHKAQKEAFFATEYTLSVAEAAVEALLSRAELNESTVIGHYAEDTQPKWKDLTWTDGAGGDAVVIPLDQLPDGLANVAEGIADVAKWGKTPQPPSYTIEQRFYKRDSARIGIGIPTGVFFFNVTARSPGSTYRSEAVIRSVYAKRFN